MALDKFEKHIKKQLQEREIPPSADAWTKIKDQLASSPEPRKKGYLWYGIAAGFIGILMVSVVYFNLKNSPDTPNVQIVDSPKETDLPEEINPIDFPQENKDIEKLVKVDSTEVDVEKVVVVNLLENEMGEEQLSLIGEASKGKVQEVDVREFEDKFIDSKILEVIAQVDALEENHISLTEDEVDSLLRRAQEEILKDKLFNQNGSVDAMALLTEVEDELNQSFRDRIFESLKVRFLKVRTAVADHNK